MVANELMLYVLIAVAIMSVLMMVRLTRAEEEAGRLELIRSLPTGRLAPPTAGLLIVATANLLVGLAVTVEIGRASCRERVWVWGDAEARTVDTNSGAAHRRA